MLYDLFRAYGDALSVATLQDVPSWPPAPHEHHAVAAPRRRRLHRLVADWLRHNRRPRLEPDFCDCR